ncbi:uncharacterized protein LOC129947740 [Eupeodes corollae]|uniref:uncharacterized protein LOC129947740 n=1 Tax=Eupeodes corollae TaxID=290404 RepID=UPI00249043F8|nr:uncharacterized protein LOC129947740 [Eupeodes corollae]
MFTSSKKCLCLAILVVLLVCPLLSHGFGAKTDDDDDTDPREAVRAVRAKAPRKFEFRKLVRVALPEEEDEEEEEENGGGGSDDEEEDDDSDDEFKFERARKLDGTKVKPTSQRASVDEYGEDYVKEKKTSSKDSEKGFFSSLFGGLFGGWWNDAPAKAPPPPPPPADKSNGIIDWIQSFSRMFKKPAPEPKPADTGIDWMSYLNRWPFNSLFPIGKPEKKISLPRSEDSSHRYASGAEPMSQDHFESLLHTVPGFVVNASHVSDIECKQQMQIFHRQLRGNKFWTLQMLDSTGKITSGLLRGNINQLGDFEMCTHAKTLVKVTSDISLRIRGKYCLAHIETQGKVDELKVPLHLAHGRGLWRSHLGNPSHFIPRYAIANWGVCIPNACSASVVQDMIETNLKPYNNTGVEFRVEVSENDCFVKTSKRITKLFKKDDKFAFAVCYLAAFWLISAAAYISENWLKVSTYLSGLFKSSTDETAEETKPDETEPTSVLEPESETPAEPVTDVEQEAEQDETSNPAIAKEIFHSFSPKRSLCELLSEERLDMQFPIFHLLKILSTFMLYVCLKYMMIGHLPITNRDKLVRTVDQPFSVVFRSPMIYTDILLIISGFLSGYQLSEEMECKTYIGVIKRVLAKVLRYLPTIYAVLFFQTWILPHLGSGPLWNKLIGQNARLCEHNMWRVLFGTQNAIDFEETCSPITIQLALELQLYMLGPLIVWLYYTDADAGFFAYGAFQAMSVAARFSRTNLEHLSAIMFHGMNVSKFYRTANILYSSPIARATPYLLGIGGGILHRFTEGNLEIPPGLTNIGWLTAVFSIGWCFWYPSSGMRSDFIYNSSEAASYASWSPLILGLAIIWIVFMTPKEGFVISTFLTSKPVLFLSRISFPMQLVSYTVVLYTVAGVKDSNKYHISDLVNVAELATIVLCSTFLAFLIDVPFQNVRLIIIKKLFTEKPLHESDSHDEVELDQSEEISEAVVDMSSDGPKPEGNETPEPPDEDDHWNTVDSDEKEHEYVVRFNSHLVNGSGAVVETSIINSSPEPEPEIEEKSEPEEEIEIEEEEDEDEEEIAEEDEIIRRPNSPDTESNPSPTPSPTQSPQPPIETKIETPSPTDEGFRRRRRPTTKDDE